MKIGAGMTRNTEFKDAAFKGLLTYLSVFLIFKPIQEEFYPLRNLLPSSRKEKGLLGAIIGTVAWFLIVWLYVANLLEPYEVKTYDHLCRLNAKQSPAPVGGS